MGKGVEWSSCTSTPYPKGSLLLSLWPPQMPAGFGHTCFHGAQKLKPTCSAVKLRVILTHNCSTSRRYLYNQKWICQCDTDIRGKSEKESVLPISIQIAFSFQKSLSSSSSSNYWHGLGNRNDKALWAREQVCEQHHQAHVLRWKQLQCKQQTLWINQSISVRCLFSILVIFHSYDSNFLMGTRVICISFSTISAHNFVWVYSSLFLCYFNVRILNY